ncbi:MAG: SDR family oxidoreductase [Oceanospirillaceae bacterium]|nr:SDR family oxidoreductase [Oceanospirillaceae bacterium]
MLKNKTILVLGAAGLLGRSVINSIIQNRGNVIAADISLDNINDSFKGVKLVSLDVNDENSVRNFFYEVDGIDGVVNCSYPRNEQYGASFFDVNLSSFNENINLHLGSSFLIMQQSASYFQRHKRPISVVNIASIYGVIAPDFSIYEKTKMTMPVEYAAIKSAILHLNKYVSEFVHDSNFRVNSISPGGIFDGQPDEFLNAYASKTHGKGMLDSSDVVHAIIFLLSDQSMFITGQNIIVDDGFTL